MKNSVFILVLFGLILFGCSGKKSEKEIVVNFIGKYETLYSAHAFAGYNDLHYYDFGKIQLEVFNVNGEIKGQGWVDLLEKWNDGYGIGQQMQRASFDLINLRAHGDTLNFEITNQILALEGKKLNGAIIKSDKGIVVAVDEHLTYLDGIDKSPYFILKKDGLVYYKESKQDLPMLSLAVNTKVNELNARLNLPEVKNVPVNLDWQRKAINASIDRIKSYQK